MAGEWRECEWGDLATLEYGKGLRDYESGTGPYRVYGTNGLIGWHNEPLCTHPGVIVGRKGAYRGIHYSPEPFFVIDTAFYLEPKEDIDLQWAYYELLTHDINSMDSGSAIPSTSREAFYRLPVKRPSLPEQHAIAHILGTLDDKIELTRRMNETLESIAQAIFKSWFVDFDPVHAKAEGRDLGLSKHVANMFPASFEKSKLGEIPKGWQIITAGDAFKVIGGSTPSTKNPEYWENGKYYWATPKDLSSLSAPILLETERKITNEGLNQISSGLLPKGTVLMSSRAPVGYLAISEVPTAVNQGFIAMICEGLVSNYYALNWCYFNMDDIKQRASGTTFAEISKASFRPIPMIMPNADVMKSFTQLVRPIYNDIEEKLRESQTLAAIRDALLPKLLSGEFRVKDAEKFIGRIV